LIGQSSDFSFVLDGGPFAGVAARQAVVAGNGALPADVREDVLLLVTELVTNAVRHAGAGPERPVRVDVRRWPRRVRVEVADPGSGFTPAAGLRRIRDHPGGWGLFLVDRISDRWGVEQATPGNCVWFEIEFEA
jgi:anti-sigma regulatory factor (Ser/Thr protein kinase)